MNPVTCANCQHFIRDKVGDGSGIGNCNELENYKATLNAMSLSPKAVDNRIELAEKKLDCKGVKVLYPDVERYCCKFLQGGDKILDGNG